MQEIQEKFKVASKEYNSGIPHLTSSLILTETCLQKLSRHCKYEIYGPFNGKRVLSYYAFSRGEQHGRPIMDSWFIRDETNFRDTINDLTQALKKNRLSPEDEVQLTKVIYTAVMAFASCIDLWNRGSRKTPGTFFEVFVAALMQVFLPECTFSKHIPLNAIIPEGGDTGEEEEKSSLSTDLVISAPHDKKRAVIPLKITTRERIVQPFAHQRILDSAFGGGVFESFLACISETQMDHKSKTVKQVCVPGTVKLFKKYLGDMKAIYYCDLPERYGEADIQELIPIKHLGMLFNDVADFLELNR